MKQKGVAAVLAFFFGVFGAHRFYLGQRFLGVIYFALFFIGMTASIEANDLIPIFAVPALIGFVDAVVFAAMPREDFDERYNRKYLYGDTRSSKYRRRPAPRSQGLREPSSLQYHRQQGIAYFREYDYEGAVIEFENALEIKYDDPSLHFNLACCYSILEDEERAIYHLDKAVQYGFDDFHKIQNHDALAYLRTTRAYEIFAVNGFRSPTRENAPLDLDEEEPLDLSGPPADNSSGDLLDQIRRLGELRDKGVLTNEEFTEQKRKLLAR